MAGVGYQGYFSQDPDPNPINIPPTGAVLNDQGTPEWEEQYPEFAQILNSPTYSEPSSTINTLRMHAPNTNLIGELEGIERNLKELIKLRSDLIERIVEERNNLNSVIEKSKKLTDDLALLDMLEEPVSLDEKDSNG